MFVERTSVGLDVHARSVAAAAIDGVTGELVQARLTPSHEHIRSWIGDLPGPVVVPPRNRMRPYGTGGRLRVRETAAASSYFQYFPHLPAHT